MLISVKKLFKEGVGVCWIDANDTFNRQALVFAVVDEPVDVFDVVKCDIIFDTNQNEVMSIKYTKTMQH